MAREIKSLPAEYIKAVNDRTVTGIFSVYGNEDLVGDVVYPGAFSKTLREGGRKALFLWQHDQDSPPIASIDSFKDLTRDELPPEVLEAAPNAMGGAQVTRTYLDTPRGNEVLAAIKAGVPLQASFAYDAIQYDFTETEGKLPVRNLRELKLYEVSDVNWGANDATIAAGKAMIDIDFLLKQLDAHLSAFKSGARHSKGDMTMLNTIHDTAVKLGADNCMGMADQQDTGSSSSDGGGKGKQDVGEHQEAEDPETEAVKSRAAAMALTVAQRKFRLLELETSILLGTTRGV